VHADNTATVYLGKGEFGQGNTTGLLQIAGEELDLEMSQLKSVLLDTNTVPNQGATTSSSSIHRGGPQIRAAAAEARQACWRWPRRGSACRPAASSVSKGVVSIDGHPSRSVSYGALLGDKPFNVKFTGIAPQKPINRYKLVGTRVPRVDIPDKMTGRYVYMQQVRVPDMLHGRIVRPSGQGAYGDGAKPLSIDESSIAAIPGARIVRKGDFVGVVAEREWDAVKAARALKVTWKESATLPSNADADLFERMRATKTTDTVIADWGDAAKAFAGAAHVASSSYRCPYQSHAPFAANCALADVGPNGALVMSSTQDIYNSRDMLAAVLGLPVAKVRVQYYEGSGTFGRSCYDDCAQAAAVMSQAVGKPVRVQFMRSDELGWDDYGPAHLATCAPASMPTASSWPTSITAGSTAGWSTRRRTSWRCRLRRRSARPAPAPFPSTA
jgi:CO/xanthine dehydrogenase Mo-binding subunit